MPRTSPDILMLIPNLDLGGAQKVFHDHSLLLGERFGVEEAVFNLDHGHAFPTGHVVHDLEVSGGGGPVTKAMNLYRRVRAARLLKERLKPKLCISHMPGADYVNLLSRRGEKTIAVVHGSKRGDDTQAGLSGRLQSHLLVPLLYRRADAVVTVSRDLAEEMADLGVDRSKLRVINNFFEHERITNMAAEPLEPPLQALFGDVPVLVTTGRLHEQKNHRGLLDTFAGLKARRPARLLILGDGPLRSELASQAEALGLRLWTAWSGEPLVPDRDVYLMGAQANPFRLMARADLFVLSSGWEGFPLALGEAMICGLPVVSTDCRTGPREMLAPDTATPAHPIEVEEEGSAGLLLPLLHQPRRARAAQAVWIEALDRLLANPDRLGRLSVAARTRMEAFSRQTIGRQWFALVEELIG
jgi:glycosyltransferase involved in cell wall biosynthesis